LHGADHFTAVKVARPTISQQRQQVDGRAPERMKDRSELISPRSVRSLASERVFRASSISKATFRSELVKLLLQVVGAEPRRCPGRSERVAFARRSACLNAEIAAYATCSQAYRSCSPILACSSRAANGGSGRRRQTEAAAVRTSSGRKEKTSWPDRREPDEQSGWIQISTIFFVFSWSWLRVRPFLRDRASATWF